MTVNSGTDQVSFSSAMGNINKMKINTTTILSSFTKVAFEFHFNFILLKQNQQKSQHPLIVTIIVQDNGRYSAVDST